MTAASRATLPKATSRVPLGCSKKRSDSVSPEVFRKAGFSERFFESLLRIRDGAISLFERAAGAYTRSLSRRARVVERERKGGLFPRSVVFERALSVFSESRSSSRGALARFSSRRKSRNFDKRRNHLAVRALGGDGAEVGRLCPTRKRRMHDSFRLPNCVRCVARDSPFATASGWAKRYRDAREDSRTLSLSLCAGARPSLRGGGGECPLEQLEPLRLVPARKRPQSDSVVDRRVDSGRWEAPRVSDKAAFRSRLVSTGNVASGRFGLVKSFERTRARVRVGFPQHARSYPLCPDTNLHPLSNHH